MLTVDDYVDRVFVPDSLPKEMSFRNLLSMVMDLMDPTELRQRQLPQQHCLIKSKLFPKQQCMHDW